MAVEYFCAYHSYLDALEPLTDAERGRLFVACLEYSKSGVASHLSGNERFIFPMIRAQIDRDNEKYTAKCKSMADNAKKRLLANASNCQQMQANATKEKTKEKEKAKEKEKENNIHPSDVCAEPPSASTPPVAQLPLNDGSLFDVTEEDYAKWCGLYPSVDVMQALRSMAGWLDAKPERRKTRRGIRAFITSWLSRDQDRGGGARPAAQRPTGGGNPFLREDL